MSEDLRLKALSLIDDIHDEDLSEALARWLESQQVGTNKSGVTCLRLAALCVARMLHKDPPPKDVECDLIETYADYFHYYVHVGVDILGKNKSRGRK